MLSPTTVHRIMQVRGWIASFHGNPIFDLLDKLANLYIRAYRNELNWDFQVNGERSSLAYAVANFPGDILDVGANRGKWAKMAEEVAPGRQIHCFEISPPTFQILVANLLPSEHLIANNVGLSSAAGHLTLNHYPESPDRSTVVEMPAAFEKKEIQVQVITGDQYIADRKIQEISYLKIDVEGFEMEVLQGFRESLSRGIIHAIQIEHAVNHVFSGHFLRDFILFFEEYGYRLFKVYPDKHIEIIYNAEEHESFVGANYVAMKPISKARSSGLPERRHGLIGQLLERRARTR